MIVKALKKLLSFFEETRGALSSQRLIYISGSYYTMFMGAWVFYSTKDFASTIAIVAALSGVFGSQKLIQKGMEQKPEEKNEK